VWAITGLDNRRMLGVLRSRDFELHPDSADRVMGAGLDLSRP